jgi:uncharacterized protein with HEPN domain
MSGFRNVLIHGYFSVAVKTVWETANTNIPQLAQTLKPLITRKKSK